MDDLRKWAQEATGKTRFTPDLTLIQSRYRRIPVFVYGTEKETLPDSVYLFGCDLIGYGNTVSNRWTVYRIHDGVIATPWSVAPVADADVEAAQIKGEVYSLTPSQLTELDRFNTTGLYCSRQYQYIQWYKKSDQTKQHKQLFTSSCLMWSASAEQFTKFCSGLNQPKALTPTQRKNGDLVYNVKARDCGASCM